MIVFDLICSKQHRFEGWFGSAENFGDQCERGLISCPVCSDGAIAKLPSAAKLRIAHQSEHQSERATSESAATAMAAPTAAVAIPEQAQFAAAVRAVLANTENVGTQFAEEARKMHYGESDIRAIRGVSTREETESLQDEGIDFFTVPGHLASDLN